MAQNLLGVRANRAENLTNKHQILNCSIWPIEHVQGQWRERNMSSSLQYLKLIRSVPNPHFIPSWSIRPTWQISVNALANVWRINKDGGKEKYQNNINSWDNINQARGFSKNFAHLWFYFKFFYLKLYSFIPVVSALTKLSYNKRKRKSNSHVKDWYADGLMI